MDEPVREQPHVDVMLSYRRHGKSQLVRVWLPGVPRVGDKVAWTEPDPEEVLRAKVTAVEWGELDIDREASVWLDLSDPVADE